MSKQSAHKVPIGNQPEMYLKQLDPKRKNETDPLKDYNPIAGEAAVLQNLLDSDPTKPGMKVFPAQWRSGKWQVFGIAIQSSTGEIVTRIPKSKRLRDRNKYDSRGRLKSKLSEPESPETPSR